MIITQINGGIGNQMFQYAFGRYLAHRNNTELKLDISIFKKYKLRKYELGVFNIEENFASAKEINQIKYSGKNILQRMAGKFSNSPKQNIIIEKKFQFDPNLLKTKDNVYLQGYWQSEKYFKEVEGIIRKEFVLKSDIIIAKYNELIQNTDSISLHIRRGDYISNPQANSLLGVCSPDYYYKAVRFLKEKVKDPVLFVFSDDVSWVKENLAFDIQTYFVDFTRDAYNDLMLMSQCKYNVIANSSFSWWGAWLNNNPKKVVTAPKRWFKKNLRDVSWMIPKSWVRL